MWRKNHYKRFIAVGKGWKEFIYICYEPPLLELLNMLGEYVSKSFNEVEKCWWIGSWFQTLLPGLLHACDLRDRGGGDIKSDWASWVGKPCLLMFKLDPGNGPEDSFRYFLFVTNAADFFDSGWLISHSENTNFVWAEPTAPNVSGPLVVLFNATAMSGSMFFGKYLQCCFRQNAQHEYRF